MFNLKTISTLVVTAALFGVVASPATAQARYGNQRGNGRVNSQRTWEIRSLVDAAERSSNAFRETVERRDVDSNTPNRAGVTARERFFNQLKPSVQRLDEAFERLRRVADNNRPRAGRNEMMDVLSRARVVDQYFTGNNRNYTWGTGRNRLTYNRSGDLDNRWRDLRRDINALARAYGMTGLNARRGW